MIPECQGKTVKYLRLGLVGLMLLTFAVPCSAWTYGQSWIITTYDLRFSGWVYQSTGGYNNGPFYWAAGQTADRWAFWNFDNSVHHGDAPTSPELFEIYQWVPKTFSSTPGFYTQVNYDGGYFDPFPYNEHIPWLTAGSNHQWLLSNQDNQGGWVKAGPDGHTPFPGLVWARGGSSFYTRWDLGISGPHSISALMIRVVPEPSTLPALASAVVAAGLLWRKRP